MKVRLKEGWRALGFLVLSACALVVACSGLATQPVSEEQPGVADGTPVIFVPGVTGTKLRDPLTGDWVWGGSRQLFKPRDGGHRLVLPLVTPAADREQARHPQAVYEAVAPLLALRIFGWTKTIYRPLKERFEAAGYRLGSLASPGEGDDFFFFDYDWRYGNLESVRLLDRQLEQLSELQGGKDVDLVCQSNAAKICRWLAKYGTLDIDEVGAQSGSRPERGYRIRKLVLVGASNSGALRVLQLLNRGRSYVPLVGRRLHPETFFSLRPLFEDLPADRDELFFDERGETLDVDLFDARNWVTYGWSIFDREVTGRLSRRPRPDLFGDHEARLDYLQRQLDRARQLQSLLARDSEWFPDAVAYYLLENNSSPTIDRVLLTSEDGGWKTYFFGDKRLAREPSLEELSSAMGDGHAILASQRGLSPQELDALAGSAAASGGHFEAVVEPGGLDSILGFLADAGADG